MISRPRPTAAACLCGLLLIASGAAANEPTFDTLISSAHAHISAGDPASALSLAERARAAAGRLDPSRAPGALLAAERLRGEAYVRMDRFGEALAILNGALRIAERTSRGSRIEADILLSAGNAYESQGDLASALRDYQRAYATYARLGDAHYQANTLVNISALYADANDYPTGLKYLNQAIDVYRDDPALLLIIYNNRGSNFQELGHYREAEASYRQALPLTRQTNNLLYRARILGNLARVRLKLHDVAGAEAYLREAMAVAADGDAATWRPQLIAIAAQAAYQRHDYTAAARLIAERFAGVDLSTTTIAFREAHQTAYDTYRALGDAPLAVAHLAALKRLDDQATKVATSATAALASAHFDFANQEARLAKIQLEAERQRAHTDRLIFFGVAAATAALIALLLVWLVTLRRSNEKVRAAAADLATSNSALGKALAAKTEFLATTSHEIRTPLNGILGMTQVMLADKRLADDLRDRIGVVHGAGVTMRALVDDILDVAKMETGNLSIERAPVDLATTLRDAAKLWEDQARDKGIGFTLDLADCPGVIEGDAARLRQIVFNLLSNALKFTSTGAVSLTARRDGDRLALAVTDSGIGIAADKRELIFESFRQADTSTTRQFGGTGLGLAICRNLAQAMGGDIAVDSCEGQGSTFTVSLPLVELAAPTAAMSTTDEQPGATIVVDANPISRAMLKTMIAGHDAAVTACAALDEVSALARVGDRIVIDQSALAGADAPDRLEALAGQGPLWVLWKGEPPDAIAAHATILAKPITAARLVEEIFTTVWQRTDRSVLVRDAA